MKINSLMCESEERVVGKVMILCFGGFALQESGPRDDFHLRHSAAMLR